MLQNRIGLVSGKYTMRWRAQTGGSHARSARRWMVTQPSLRTRCRFRCGAPPRRPRARAARWASKETRSPGRSSCCQMRRLVSIACSNVRCRTYGGRPPVRLPRSSPRAKEMGLEMLSMTERWQGPKSPGGPYEPGRLAASCDRCRSCSRTCFARMQNRRT